MSQNRETDGFRRRLEEVQAEAIGESVPMTFEGFPVRVRPLPRIYFINAGRMPEHLTTQIIRLSDGEGGQVTETTNSRSAAESVASEHFMRFAVCRVLTEPVVVEVEPVPAGGYLYADLFITAPAFCRAVYQWILNDCPLPAEEKGEGVLGVEDLERFPSVEAGVQRVDAGNTGAGGGPPSVGVAAPHRKRTRRK